MPIRRPSRFLVVVPAAVLALSGLGVAAAGMAAAQTAPAATGPTTIEMTIVNNSHYTMRLDGKVSDGTVEDNWMMREIPAKSTAVINARADRGFTVDLDYDLTARFDPSFHGHVRLHADTTTPRGAASAGADGARATTQPTKDAPNLAARYTIDG